MANKFTNMTVAEIDAYLVAELEDNAQMMVELDNVASELRAAFKRRRLPLLVPAIMFAAWGGFALWLFLHNCGNWPETMALGICQ